MQTPTEAEATKFVGVNARLFFLASLKVPVKKLSQAFSTKLLAKVTMNIILSVQMAYLLHCLPLVINDKG